ncbi:MAG TPA: hypothetical protein VID03_04765 [Acidimicrobiia bacterium]|jgi:hypothetical protein
MYPDSYDPMPMASIRCPRCGVGLDIRFLEGAEPEAAYAGVCTTPLPGAGRCGTVLQLRVTAHVFTALGESGR